MNATGTFEELLPHQPPRASVRFPHEPWASAQRLIGKSDTDFPNGAYRRAMIRTREKWPSANSGRWLVISWRWLVSPRPQRAARGALPTRLNVCAILSRAVYGCDYCRRGNYVLIKLQWRHGSLSMTLFSRFCDPPVFAGVD